MRDEDAEQEMSVAIYGVGDVGCAVDHNVWGEVRAMEEETFTPTEIDGQPR